MTREQALKVLTDNKEYSEAYGIGYIPDDVAFNLVEKIYDDIESEKCENCVYNISTDNEFGFCSNGVVDLECDVHPSVSIDFRCSKWEKGE